MTVGQLPALPAAIPSAFSLLTMRAASVIPLLSVLVPVLALRAQVVPVGTQVPPAPDAKEVVNSLGMKFVPVSGTTVLFATYETQVSDFAAFVKSSGYPWAFKPHFAQTSADPVVGVNLKDALAFCNWLTESERKLGRLRPDQGYRVPTNEEWSAASGGGIQRQEKLATDARLQETMRFVWGLEWPPPQGAGNFESDELKDEGGAGDEFPFTAPVGKFKPTAEGLYDLAGNAWEWTWDRELRATPLGTLRGGSWAYFKRECLTANYVYEVPTDLRAPTTGFRCVLEDRQRTARLKLAANEAEMREEQQKKKELLTKSTVDRKAVEMVLKSSGTALQPLDPATLAKASPGQPFKNPLRMEFLPVEGLKVLFGRTEVSMNQVEKWIKEEGRQLAKTYFESGPTDPVVNITWDDATAYCAWLTAQDRAAGLLPEKARYRLPTDLEWSVAAGLKDEKGADPALRHQANKEHYPWGTWPPKPSTANLDAPNVPGFQDTYSYTAPVGSLIPNAAGIHDLGGNVAEWCEDAWPGLPDEHVARGGSWIMSSPVALLTSSRQHAAHAAARFDLGLRCVLDFGEP